MIELVPNNSKRVEITITQPNGARVPTNVPGLTVTAQIVTDKTVTTAVTGLSYSCSEYLDANGQNLGYYADVLGADLTTAVNAALITYDQEVFVQFIVGTVIAGWLKAIIRQTRRLENA